MDLLSLTQNKHAVKGKHEMEYHIRQGQAKLSGSPFPFGCPGPQYDRLFNARYIHIDSSSEETQCQSCDSQQLVRRTRRDKPDVFYGLIGSADTVMRDAKERDALRNSRGVLCFEMEAAGLMNTINCLVIRGISDYADSHKNDIWQPYAALTAAAYAKDLLSVIPAKQVEAEEPDRKQLTDLFQRMQGQLSDNDRNAVVSGLPCLDFESHQQRLIEVSARIGRGTIEKESFTRWADGKLPHLRLYGPPGVGKTHLCALIVDHLQRSQPQTGARRPVIYVYLSDDRTQEQTEENVLGSLVKQLIRCTEPVHVPVALWEAWRNELDRKTALKLAFEELLQTFDRTYLIVDGFYQCSAEVLEILNDYPLRLVNQGLRLSLLTTSPSYRKVHKVIHCNYCNTESLHIYFNCSCDGNDYDLCATCRDKGVPCPSNHDGREPYNVVRMEVRPTREEIAQVCRYKIEKASSYGSKEWDTREHASPPHKDSRLARDLYKEPALIEQIPDYIATRAQANLLVASAWVEVCLKRKHKVHDWREFTAGLDSAAFEGLKSYCANRINPVKDCPEERDLRFRVFRVLMAVFRPINLLALKHALALESHRLIHKLHLKGRVDILRATKNFIVIDKASKSTSFVRFFHGTMYKMLKETDDPLLQHADAKMASVCLEYLKCDLEEHSSNLDSYPFAEYTLEYWGDHVRRACEGNHGTLTDDSVGFLEDAENVQRIGRIAQGIEKDLFYGWIHETVSATHLCAWFGMAKVLARLHRDGHSVTEPDGEFQRDPLDFACIRGHLATVKKLLLLSKVPPRDTAIRYAIDGFAGTEGKETERVGIVKALLEQTGRSINAVIPSLDDTVLTYAVREGYYGFAKVLLDDGELDINAPDTDGYTALWHATNSECDPPADIVRLLVEKGASSDIRVPATEQMVLAPAVSPCSFTAATDLLECESNNIPSSKGLIELAPRREDQEVVHNLRDTTLAKAPVVTEGMGTSITEIVEGDGIAEGKRAETRTIRRLWKRLRSL